MIVGERMKQPLVSVIMPAYRCAATIGDAIDSVLLQNVPLELLVINDCSPDNLEEVVSAYADNPSIVYICNESNLGAAQSRNKGISMASGKYIAFLDSDDVWMPGKLEKQLQKMKEEEYSLCCTARELMTPEGELTKKVLQVKEKITFQDLLKHNSIACSSVLIRTEIAQEFPMEHEDSHEDYIMWMRVLQKYGTACGINEPLLRYRLSNTGKSGSKMKSAKMTFKAYRYMGFGLMKSLSCFVAYAVNGFRKYYLS